MIFKTKRSEIACLLCIIILLSYTIRVHISVVILHLERVMYLNSKQESIILSSFYAGYTLGQIPISLLIELNYINVKQYLGYTILIPSILTLGIPMMSTIGIEFVCLFRFAIGLIQSAMFPIIYYFYTTWIPKDEKTLMIPRINLGIFIGEIIGFGLPGIDASFKHWKSSFYYFGLAGIVLYPIWISYGYESPSKHPFISAEELKYLSQSTNSSNNNNLNREQREEAFRSIPWLTFFSHPVSLTYFLCHLTYGFIMFLLLSKVPSFIVQELHFKLTTSYSGLLYILPYLVLMLFSYLFSNLFDYLMEIQVINSKSIRQIAQITSFGGCCLCLLLCGYLQDYQYLSYASLLFGQAFLAISQCGINCVYLETSPRYSIILNSIGNSFASLGGVLSPLLVSYFTTRYEGIQGWRALFVFTNFICFISIYFWYKYQSSDIIPELNEPYKDMSKEFIPNSCVVIESIKL